VQQDDDALAFERRRLAGPDAIADPVGKAAPTGIDRVELAWARAPSGCGGDARVCRTTRGFLLLPPDGVRALSGDARMAARRWAAPIGGRG
jgi:hypothetical protein